MRIDRVQKILGGALVLLLALATLSGAQEKAADNMQILRDKIRADKKLLVATNMELTESEAQGFWPIYEQYQKDLQQINQRIARVLEGYAAQTDPDFELVVADDGSGPETRAIVEAFAARARFPVRHVWQEDTGFRAAAIRNKAVAGTDADYVIFTDGDCIPAPDFVAQHRWLAEPGWFLSANRVLLSERFTRDVLAGRIPVHRWRLTRWLGAWLRRGKELDFQPSAGHAERREEVVDGPSESRGGPAPLGGQGATDLRHISCRGRQLVRDAP